MVRIKVMSQLDGPVIVDYEVAMKTTGQLVTTVELEAAIKNQLDNQ